MVDDFSYLDFVNSGFGISWAPVAGKDPIPSNMVKLEFSIPFFSEFLWHMGESVGAQLDESLHVRALLSTSLVGLPAMLAIDLVASLTSQVANVFFSNTTV